MDKNAQRAGRKVARRFWVLMAGALVLTLLLAGLPVQAQTAPGKLDVMFLFDLSASMAPTDCKATAAAVKDSLSDMGWLDVRFGVASHVDYPDYTNSVIPWGAGSQMGVLYGWSVSGDYAWNLDQDLTADVALVNSVIAGLAFHSGGDSPQNYARALLDTAARPDPVGAPPSALVSWRADAIRVIIMFADDAPHASNDAPPTFLTWGEDPGRDATGGTADDLDMGFLLDELAGNGFEVVTVDYSGGDPDIAPGTGFEADDAAWWMRAIGTQTHGAWFPTGGGPAVGFDHEIEDFIANKMPRQLPAGIPTLSQWGTIAMAAVFAGLLVWTMRRRRLAS